MLHDQLDRVALMLEQSAPFSPREAFVWRCLARDVDTRHFERTGQILAPIRTPEEIVRQGGDQDEYAVADVEEGVETLTKNGFLSVQQSKQGTFFRMHLPQGVFSSEG